MAATADAHRLDRLRESHPAWALLRAENAATTLALLGQHFDHSTRRLPVPELHARVDADLQELRKRASTCPVPGRHIAATGSAPASCCAGPPKALVRKLSSPPKAPSRR